MCGLAGLLSYPGAQFADLEKLVGKMTQTIVHRGPDDVGIWADTGAGIALGHRRLSILDLSPAGHQPMHSTCGRFVIAFNGEIYNHQSIRTRLHEATGSAVSWRGHSDTETLLAGIARWGVEDTLAMCKGMFAFALWDRHERVLTLARDRLGEKPLYYGWQDDVFLFGSELKALKAHPAFAAEVDRIALALFLRHSYVPAPYSIYKGIRKLPPGHFVQIQGDSAGYEAPRCYWSVGEVATRGVAQPFAGSAAEAIELLEQKLGDAVRGQMLADVPLGALLSGGIDSSVVCALMQAHSSQPVKTFTIGFDDKIYNEAEHAKAVARHLGTDHTELYVQPEDALALVPALASMWDEPFGDSSQLPTHMVMKLARQQVTVALSGDGGDELFGGYNRYSVGPKLWQYTGWLPKPLRRGIGALLTSLPATKINRISAPLANRVGIAQPGDKAHKLGQRLRKVQSIDDVYVSLVTEWPDAEAMVKGAAIPHYLLDDRAQWPRLSNPVHRMMALDALTYLPDDILVKVDRAAMAVSLETRAPFLDRDVVEFAWQLPLAMNISGGQRKRLLRGLLDRYVPRELIDRPKMGFGIPLDDWLRGPLRDWAEALLAEDRLVREGYFDPAPIREAWQSHCAGHANYGHRLWSVLMFQAWLEEQ